jgi:hypothetical protein
VRARGRDVLLFPIRGFADAALTRFPHHWIHLGAFGRPLRLMREAGCTEMVMIGSLVRPRLWQLRLDLTTLFLLPRLAPLFRGGDDRLLSGVADLIEARGIKLRGAHEVAPELLMPEGVAGNHRPRPEDEDDIRFGFELLRAIGPYDVGQSLAVAGHRVLAVEAVEGTRAMLARIAALRRDGRLNLPPRTGVLVKAPKPGQDRRVDLPAIGLETIAEAKEAGLAGIAVEAGGTIVADAGALARAADKAGVFIVGVGPAEKSR